MKKTKKQLSTRRVLLKRVSLVAPAYNEEKCIVAFVQKAIQAFKKNKLTGEIIVVNDGSTDNTGKLLNQLSKKEKLLKVLHNKKNKGLTGATWRGFQEAKEPIIIFLPSDLESDPEKDIPLLLTPLKEGYDMSIGRRMGRKASKIKSMSSFLFNSCVRLLFSVSLHDLGWVKAFKREVLSDIALRSDWHRFFAVLVAHKGYKIKEVPTPFYPREITESKFGRLGFMRVPGAFFDMIAIKLLLSFSRKPMFVFGMVGSILLLLGFIGGCYLVALKILQGHIGSHIPLMFLVVILLLMGTQLFAFGFLAECIVTLGDSFKRKK